MSSTNTNSDASSDGAKTSNPAQLHSKRPNPRPPPNLPFPLSYPPSASTSARKPRPASFDSSSSPSHPQQHQQHAHPQASPRDRRNSLLLQGPLNIPIPPTLRDSPFVRSPESIFRRSHSSTPHSPSKEEDRWLGDTVPMNVDSANSKSPVSISGSLRRMDENAGENSEIRVSGGASSPSEIVTVSRDKPLKDFVSSPPPFPPTSSITGKDGHSDDDGKRPINTLLQTNIEEVGNEKR